jgi:hypothetical protein
VDVGEGSVGEGAERGCRVLSEVGALQGRWQRQGCIVGAGGKHITGQGMSDKGGRGQNLEGLGRPIKGIECYTRSLTVVSIDRLDIHCSSIQPGVPSPHSQRWGSSHSKVFHHISCQRVSTSQSLLHLLMMSF